MTILHGCCGASTGLGIHEQSRQRSTQKMFCPTLIVTNKGREFIVDAFEIFEIYDDEEVIETKQLTRDA